MHILRIFILSMFVCFQANAQSLLNQQMTLDVNRQKLADVLEIISNKGNFYFSYNSTIVKRDSLVSGAFRNQTVRQILETFLTTNYEFKESGNYLIIRRKPIQVTITTTTKAMPAPEKFYQVTGYVTDAENGAKLSEASVYEREQLVSSLTDGQGFFKLKLKSKYTEAALWVSKEFYQDTSVAIQPGTNQQTDIWLMPIESGYVTISPEDYLLPDSLKSQNQPQDTSAAQPLKITDTTKVDNRFLSRAFVSSMQKIQSFNLGKFFTSKPFQFSLIPGVGTHGKMSGQVINKFSLNALGGYTGGLNGFEVGGLFNINKKDAQYFQAAGLFNLTGGRQRGFQAAGIGNTVLDSVAGFQAAGIVNYVEGTTRGFQTAGVYNHALGNMHGMQSSGIANYVKKDMQGFQMAGVYNHVHGKTKGYQVAGVGNFSNDSLKGVQIAGVANYARTTNGVQIAGVVNYTNHLKGLQIGLINIADTSDGYSIGLINFVRRGYHKINISTHESFDLQVELKTGNRKLYSILAAGINTNSNEKLYSYGYGIGSELINKKYVALNTDLTSHYLYMGSWGYMNSLNKLSLNFHIKFNKYISIFGGPSFSLFYTNQPSKIPGYAFDLPRNGYARFGDQTGWRGWGGWQAGISLF